jgi:SAM-dependent methyltransferase
MGGQGGFHPFRAVRAAAAAARGESGPSRLDLKAINLAYVADAKRRMPHEAAMEVAVGGSFDAIGRVERALLERFGLPDNGYLIDIGCGSGRLAKALRPDWRGLYLGVDLVPDLIAHARQVGWKPSWRFEVIDHIEIPEREGRADMVCFFSVMTHLLHEQSYWYLEESRRVLKPGGRVVFSFLEYADPLHWPVFMDTLAASKGRTSVPLNVFLDRASIDLWAERLGFVVEALHGGSEALVAEGALGQAVCVLRRA